MGFAVLTFLLDRWKTRYILPCGFVNTRCGWKTLFHGGAEFGVNFGAALNTEFGGF